MNQNSLSPHRSLARGSTCWVLGVVAAAAVGCSDDTGSNPTPVPSSTTTSTASGTTTALTSSTSPLTSGPSVVPSTTGPGITTSSTSTVSTPTGTSDTGETTAPDTSTAATTSAGGESSGSIETDTVDVPTLDMGDAGADAATEEVTSDGMDTSSEVVTEVDASVSEETTLDETTDEVTSDGPIDTSSTIDVASSSAGDTTSEDGYGANLVTNTGFEAGNVTGWFPTGGQLSAVTTYAKTGTYSAWLTGRTDDWNGIALNLMPLVTQGTTYQVTGSVRVSSASDTVKISVATQCDGGATTYPSIVTGTASNTAWLDLSGTYTVPVCVNWTKLEFYVEGPPAGIDIFIDDMVIREVL